jgi:enediyne biosynthesis protein CalE5
MAITTTPGAIKDTVRRQWTSAAAGWDARFDWYDRHFAPVIRWACDAMSVEAGEKVLDVGCGAGQLACEAARRAGPAGRVVGIDLAPAMLEVAARRSSALGLGAIEFKEMDAEHLSFADATFDAVACSYALMFCPEPRRAMAEMRRVLERGGRLACVVWDTPASSPFLTVAGQSIGQMFPSPPADPDAPGAFRFAQPGALENLLREAGMRDVSVEPVPMTFVFESVDDYWQLFLDCAAGVRGKVASLDTRDAERLRGLLTDAAAPHISGGRLTLTATSLCGRGIRAN